jgi:hypothetical protein
VLARGRRLARRVGDVFPCTPLGLVVLGGAALALFYYGVKRVDLILLVVGVVTLAIGALAILLVSVTALVLWLTRRRALGGAALRLECGTPIRTDFSLSSLWYVPFVKVAWTWLEPDASVEIVRRHRRLNEVITPLRRGIHERIVRRIEVGDAFGLVKIAFNSVEERTVRLLPSIGALRQVNVVRSLATGDDLPHPSGQPEGDRADLRRYAPGDPVRFMLWKVFAKSRQAVVRMPEQAVSPARQTCAYVVAARDDEAAAGTARLAVDTGAFGSEWVLGADGTDERAKGKTQALEVLARSARCPEDQTGAGLASFLDRHAASGSARVVVFVPPTPGPWLDRVIVAAKARGSSRRVAGIDFIVCADGIERQKKRSWLARVALQSTSGEVKNAPAPAASVAAVVRALAGAKAHVLVIDRKVGRVYAEGHQRALDAA